MSRRNAVIAPAMPLPSPAEVRDFLSGIILALAYTYRSIVHRRPIPRSGAFHFTTRSTTGCTRATPRAMV